VVSFAERNSENAQRELRDSVSKSLYADHVQKMFGPLKKLKRGSKLERSFAAAGRTIVIHVSI
jgi:hypothetical protein